MPRRRGLCWGKQKRATSIASAGSAAQRGGGRAAAGSSTARSRLPACDAVVHPPPSVSAARSDDRTGPGSLGRLLPGRCSTSSSPHRTHRAGHLGCHPPAAARPVRPGVLVGGRCGGGAAARAPPLLVPCQRPVLLPSPLHTTCSMASSSVTRRASAASRQPVVAQASAAAGDVQGDMLDKASPANVGIVRLAAVLLTIAAVRGGRRHLGRRSSAWCMPAAHGDSSRSAVALDALTYSRAAGVAVDRVPARRGRRLCAPAGVRGAAGRHRVDDIHRGQ